MRCYYSTAGICKKYAELGNEKFQRLVAILTGNIRAIGAFENVQPLPRRISASALRRSR
jgi:hypothetical protein